MNLINFRAITSFSSEFRLGAAEGKVDSGRKRYCDGMRVELVIIYRLQHCAQYLN